MENDWIIAHGGRWYCAVLWDDGPTEQCYDPMGIMDRCLRWRADHMMSKERAIKLVDKLNGPRGDLRKV